VIAISAVTREELPFCLLNPILKNQEKKMPKLLPALITIALSSTFSFNAAADTHKQDSYGAHGTHGSKDHKDKSKAHAEKDEAHARKSMEHAEKDKAHAEKAHAEANKSDKK
jgi:hypothetical protein